MRSKAFRVPPAPRAARVESLETRRLFAAPTPVGAQENVSNTADMSEGPQIHAAGNDVHVVWAERGERAIRYERKSAGGAWPATSDVFADGVDARYQFPDVTVTPDGTTHVVYPVVRFATTVSPVYHRSKPAGGTWSSPHEVASDNFPNPARVASDSTGGLWAVWRNNDGTAIRYRRSTDAGLTWTGGDIATGNGNLFEPNIAIGPDNIPHVIWHRRDAAFNADTARYADWNGTGWTDGQIGGTGGYVGEAVITVGPDNVQHAVWRRQAAGSTDWIIQYARRAPGGSWTPQQDVRRTPGNAGYSPAVAVDPAGAVHVAWSELNGAGRDVFYSVRDPRTGAFGPIANVSEFSDGWNSGMSLATTPTGVGGANLTHIAYQRGLRGQDVDDIYYRAFSTDFVAPTADVIDVAPDPRTTAVDAITIQFSEPVSGFDLADLRLMRDGTAVALTSAQTLTAVDDRTFRLNNLAGLTGGAGAYVVRVAAADSGVTDGAAGNALAADASDAWTVTAPVAGGTLRFDFGTATSPLASGHTRVTHASTYAAAQGFGFQAGTVNSVDRTNVADPLNRDLVWTSDAIFGTDLPAGTYDVTVTMGDVNPHDQMAVLIEGAQQEVLTHAANQYLVRTYRVQVMDGQLNLRLRDLGNAAGFYTAAVLNGLVVAPASAEPPSTRRFDFGTATSPVASGYTRATPGSTYSATAGFGWQAGTVNAVDRTNVADPLNRDLVWSNDATFAADLPSGRYDVTVTLGDVNAHDQMAVLLEGQQREVLTHAANQYLVRTYRVEVADGQLTLRLRDLGNASGFYTAAVLNGLVVAPAASEPPTSGRFDFGTATSPLAPDHTRVTHASTYGVAAGFGWQAGTINSVDRTNVADPLKRDLVWTSDGTFAADLANGTYDVTVTMGDQVAHDQMAVLLEGTQREVLTHAANQYLVRTYRVAVADGQLTLRLRDLGNASGFSTAAILNGLAVAPAATETRPTSIALDFSASRNDLGQAPMTAAEVAGAVPQANWNSTPQPPADTSPVSGTLPNLKTAAGAATAASATYAAPNNYSNRYPEDVSGDYRMMDGYLDPNGTTAATVTFNDLPFVGTYDVYVYADGDSRDNWRVGTYAISGAASGNATVSKGDPLQNRDDVAAGYRFVFDEGSDYYAQRPAGGLAGDRQPVRPVGGGNYVLFRGVSGSSFTLTATPNANLTTAAGGDVPRAPVNGIQIVGAAPVTTTTATTSAGPSSGTTSPSTSTSTAAAAAAAPRMIAIDPLSIRNNSEPANGPDGQQALGAGDVAGAPGVRQANWNALPVDRPYGNHATRTGFRDHTGAATSLGLTHFADTNFSVNFLEHLSPDHRMMDGYFDTANFFGEVPTSFAFTDVPYAAYDVYVYADGSNHEGQNDRYGVYTLSTTPGAMPTPMSVRKYDTPVTEQAQNGTATFAYDDATADGQGNYIVFRNVTGPRFTLTATPVAGGNPRAAVNGIQIVERV